LFFLEPRASNVEPGIPQASFLGISSRRGEQDGVFSSVSENSIFRQPQQNLLSGVCILHLKRKGLFKPILFTFCFSALVVVWLGFGERGFIHLYRMEKERQSYIDRIRKLEAENRALLDEIDRLLNDHDYVESVARRELGFVKNDEVLYRFAQQEEEQTLSETTKDPH
jgi:cell division protein FtsB